jgi:beta-fructofuranosidase
MRDPETTSMQNVPERARVQRRRFLQSISALALMPVLGKAAFAKSRVRPAPLMPPDGTFPSPTPRYWFAATLEEQEAQLSTNPLLRRFAESRKALASDPYRPAYHFVSPESSLNDPNGLCFWLGKWHLFYQAYPPDEFPEWKDAAKRRQHWGHAVSDDLMHWRDLPYAIYPGVEKMVFSGGTMAEQDKVVAFYPGIGATRPNAPKEPAAQMVAVASDPLLLNWAKLPPLDMDFGDADIWKQGQTYYGLVGGSKKYEPGTLAKPDPFRTEEMQKEYGLGVWPKWTLFTSADLRTWRPSGALLAEDTPFADRYDDGACPNLQRIGDKHILLYFSHTNGGRYFLGDYDEASARFRPYDHGTFNHGKVAPGGVHAPSATTDHNGDVIAIFNINDAKPTKGWDQLMSLPLRLSLDADKRLTIAPVEAVTSLRHDHRHIAETALAPNEEVVLAVGGNTLELEAEIDPEEAQQVRLNLLRSPDGLEHTSITLFNFDRRQSYWWYDSQPEIVLDGSRSSISKDVSPRPPERAILRMKPGETLKLRIFVDRSVVEVFANGRQYLAMRVYPQRRDSLGVSLEARGSRALLKQLDAWQLASIWP